jgi:hypothetical protein
MVIQAIKQIFGSSAGFLREYLEKIAFEFNNSQTEV